jgi:hypothetical protein
MITCIIRYQIDPFQRDEFKTCAENWGRIIPRSGDSEALENFAMAQSKRIILREERNFVEVVEGTFHVDPS